MTPKSHMDDLLGPLQERAKELRCLYRVMEVLGRVDAPMDEVFTRFLQAIPEGWQYPGICRALLKVGDQTYRSPNFQTSSWVQRAKILVGGQEAGELSVFYTERRPDVGGGPFLPEERQLLETLASRVGLFLLERGWEGGHPRGSQGSRKEGERGDWRVVLDFLSKSDPQLHRRLTGKMLSLLRWKGVSGIDQLHKAAGSVGVDENRPLRQAPGPAVVPADQVFAIAEANCTAAEILGYVEMWLGKEKVAFLVNTVEEQSSSLADITDALERFKVLDLSEAELPASVQTTIRVALLRRLFTDQLAFINIAKGLATIDDFQELVQHVLHPPRSHGRLGGKSAGLFLARKIVEASAESASILRDIKVPRTWYLTSDAIVAFVRYNNLDDVHDRKYLDIEQVRQQYPHVVQVFKNAAFPPEMVKGLSSVLEDLGPVPLIVRSSSLLEDRVGAAFSGKYKSLFLGNQGTKQDRLRALQDAIAEVYASMFGPDPIEYRAERNLLDVHEEMGIMIQEVVGTRVGAYFLPAFSGVAFTNNEFRWSPRIRREDGLVRLVPGLGTRAVDRLSDDYPVLLAPGQPGLRANVSVDEVVRYSPKMVDLINLETNDFETIPVSRLLAECGEKLPLVRRMVSLVDGDRLRPPRGLTDDVGAGQAVFTFEGLTSETAFVARMATLLRVLQDRLGGPVDVEFASDGESLYLLQCRPQSYGGLDAPPNIPRDVPPERLLFSACRYVSNGRVDAVTHIVYVDPDAYAGLGDLDALLDVGRAVGRLNQALPRRQFVLMGPGRWGSRGDIRLGVSVGYADISNTALLIEIARKKGNYAPDLSFGTHFFQDLVEGGIRYLPLYPDEPTNHFDETFLRTARSHLTELLPEFEHLDGVVRVIDVPEVSGGLQLRVLMNGESEEAVGIFCEADCREGEAPLWKPFSPGSGVPEGVQDVSDGHWEWRLVMAERIAEQVAGIHPGVRGMWVYGSTKNATAGSGSDLDLLVHFTGGEDERRALLAWLDGWGRALTEANFLRTGHRVEPLLDVSLISDEDIAARRGLAAKITAGTDAARRLGAV